MSSAASASVLGTVILLDLDCSVSWHFTDYKPIYRIDFKCILGFGGYLF